MEKSRKVFPLCGKIAKTFSIVWKNPEKVFHTVENFGFRGVSQCLGVGFHLAILAPACYIRNVLKVQPDSLTEKDWSLSWELLTA